MRDPLDVFTGTAEAVPAQRAGGNGRIIAASPIDSELARNAFALPVPISELGAEAAVSWIWTGYVASQCVSLFSGIWKAGKSCLIAHLLRSMEKGGELATNVTATRALVISEESRGLWARRRDEIGLADHVHLINRPFRRRPNLDEWETFVGFVAGLVRTEEYGIVVLDPISNLWPVYK